MEKTSGLRSKPGSGTTRTHWPGAGSPSKGMAAAGPAAAGDLQATTYLVPDPTDDLLFLNDREQVMRYPTAPSAWLRAACGVAGRDLTRAEWDRYLPGREYRATCSDLG